jgi:hypothetical protein
MKALTVSLILIFFTASVFCQNESIKKLILDYDDSKSILISRGRALLTDKLIERDLALVKDVKDYLTVEMEDDNYIALYPAEYFLILYWTKEYDELTGNLGKYDLYLDEGYRTRIRPPADMLYEKLLEHSVKYSASLKEQIKDAEPDEEKRDFLILNLRYLISEKHKNNFIQDSLNLQADGFIAKYPDSFYNDYSRKYIRYKLIPGDWGLGYEFFSGYGIYTDVLSEHYTNNVPFGVAFDICYRRYELYLRNYIGVNKTRINHDYSLGTFEKGSGTMVFLPEASFGYIFADRTGFKISAFAGIGAMDIGPTHNAVRNIPELAEVTLEFSTTYLAGMNLDLKLRVRGGPEYNPRASYSFMRIRYAFGVPRFKNKYSDIHGNMHYLTIGFGGISRGLKRDY